MLWSALKTAISKGNLSLVLKLLKEAHLPLNAINPSDGQSLLFYSITYHKQDLIHYFLSQETPGSKIPLDFEGNSPLMIASQYGNIEAFKTYLQAFPYSISIVNMYGRNALLIAIEQGHIEIVKILVERNVDVGDQSTDRDGSTPLHLASAWGHYDIAALLLQEGATLFETNKKGFTPIDYAYSQEMKNHLIACVDAIKNNKPIVIPKKKPILDKSGTSDAQTAAAYVSYLRTIF